ncbi:MAG: hypothetical protein F4006_04570 [Candidatus Dadabacteria bacterium]|nr:hypothetical protein [Candidatus Dadabacteria bacterium]
MISPISPLETQASFLVLGNMLEKRFGIAYPLYSEGEEQRSYFVICSSFLIAMLKYAETGDLKGAKEYSKAFRNS